MLMSRSEFEKKMFFYGIACLIVAIMALGVYLGLPSARVPETLLGIGIFFIVGIAFLVVWAWERQAKKD